MGEKLGQHFLQDKAVVKDIGKAASIETSDVVLEVGPGTGVLTQEMLAVGAKVIAVEKDPALAGKQKDKFSEATESGKLKVVNADIRDIDLSDLPSDYKVVANIPYYLTSQLLKKLTTADNQPNTVVMLVQKEVAQRVADSDTNSVLSLSIKAYGDPEVVRYVNSDKFSPPPKVDSAVLKITDINTDFFTNINQKQFFELIKTGFEHKRKQLKNNLIRKWKKDVVKNALAACDLNPKVRAERLNLQDWQCLYRKLQYNSS